MAVYKRGETWWYDFTVNRQRYRESTGKRKKAEAQDVERRERQRAEEAGELGTSSRGKAHTLGEVADTWFSANVAGKKTETDVALRLRTLFRHMDRDLLVREIGPKEITAAILSRRLEPTRQSRKAKTPRGPANGTVNRDLIDTTLRPMLRFAAYSLEETIKPIKWSELRLKEPKGRTRSFTPDELTAWRSKLPEWHRYLFDFLGVYGLRLDEAFFPPAAVNPQAGIITVTDTKNGTDHEIPIHEDDMPDLARRAKMAALAGLKTIWFKERKGRLIPIRYRGFQSASATALKLAGVTNAKPAHDLRHHAATTLYRATGSIKLVQDLLNHKTVASSARYAHTNKDDLRRAMRIARVTKRDTEATDDATTPD